MGFMIVVPTAQGVIVLVEKERLEFHAGHVGIGEDDNGEPIMAPARLANAIYQGETEAPGFASAGRHGGIFMVLGPVSEDFSGMRVHWHSR